MLLAYYDYNKYNSQCDTSFGTGPFDLAEATLVQKQDHASQDKAREQFTFFNPSYTSANQKCHQSVAVTLS